VALINSGYRLAAGQIVAQSVTSDQLPAISFLLVGYQIRTYANKPRNRVSDLDQTAQIRIFRRETRFLRKSSKWKMKSINCYYF